MTHSAFAIGAGAWTLAFYVRITGSSSFQSIVNRDPDSVQGGSETFSCKTVYMDIYTRTADDLGPPWALPYTNGTWYNFALTWDGIDDATGWVGGVQQSIHADGSAGLNFTSATNCRIGSRPDGTNPLVGQFKNLRFYPRVLTASEIGAL